MSGTAAGQSAFTEPRARVETATDQAIFVALATEPENSWQAERRRACIRAHGACEVRRTRKLVAHGRTRCDLEGIELGRTALGKPRRRTAVRLARRLRHAVEIVGVDEVH